MAAGVRAQIGKKPQNLVVRLAQAGHQPGLGKDLGGVPPREVQDAEGLSVVGLRADARVESLHGLHIVVEHMRAGVEDAGDGGEIAVEVRSKDFDPGCWEGLPDRPNGFGEVGGASVGEVVSIHRGDDDVAKGHASGHLGDMSRFAGVQGKGVLSRESLGHGAKATTSRAEIAQDHEGGLAAMETFVQVGTAGGFAHRVKAEFAQSPFERGDRLGMGGGFPEPLRQTAPPGGPRRGKRVFDVDQVGVRQTTIVDGGRKRACRTALHFAREAFIADGGQVITQLAEFVGRGGRTDQDAEKVRIRHGGDGDAKALL